jgi:hypothetical protein
VLPVIIPTPRAHSIAARTLRTEGVPYAEALCDDHLDYSVLLSDLWHAVEAFILVEHDIAPWPGALRELSECEEDACAFQYVNGGFPGGYGFSLGCIKFTPEYIAAHPIGESLLGTRWQDLDTRLWMIVDAQAVHLHSPGVAHAREIM